MPALLRRKRRRMEAMVAGWARPGYGCRAARRWCRARSPRRVARLVSNPSRSPSWCDICVVRRLRADDKDRAVVDRDGSRARLKVKPMNTRDVGPATTA